MQAIPQADADRAELFRGRDEKTHGLRWNDSRIRDPVHADRLLLIMALATTQLIQPGLAVLRGGHWCELERTDRRSLSLFQLG